MDSNIEEKLAELTRQEEMSALLDGRRIEELNSTILDKFIDIQKSKGSDYKKAKEWEKFNNDFISQHEDDLKKITLKIDANYLKSQLGEARIICHDGWKFDIRVSLFGEFESISFSEVVFNEYFWVGGIFKELIRFDNVTFMGLVNFHESIFEETVYFRKVVFDAGASFSRSEFNGQSSFEIISLKRKAKQQKYYQKQSISFEGSEFDKRAEFELRDLDICTFSLDGTIFRGSFNMQTDNSSINTLDLDRTMFIGVTRFVPYMRDKDRKNIKNINLDYTTFRGSTIFEIRLAKCPDFSKCYHFKKFFIKETWPIITYQQIKPQDRDKFLFLKRHFAAAKNHIRENRYFGYEMRAREKALENYLSCRFKGKYCRRFIYLLSKLATKRTRKMIVHRFRLFSRKYCELFLFKSYKWLSCYGSSVERPIFALMFSFLYFGFYYDVNFVKNPYEKSFVRTLNPLYDSGQGFSRLLDFQVVVATQSLVNTILLFLIFLGIRNRFKIRN